MYDKEFIQRVCELTCTKSIIPDDLSTVKYDTAQPFKKYYSFSIIKRAIEKFISKEWNDQALAHWANAYNWILSGGFADGASDDLDEFEKLCSGAIAWNLDGLSFFSGKHTKKNGQQMYEAIQLFETFDHIWQTREQWEAVCKVIDKNDKYDTEQQIALVNKKAREYAVIYSYDPKNESEDSRRSFVGKEEFDKMIDTLKKDGYKPLSCSEVE